ncbi:MAG: class B sortase [Oscillospiraceae bacterium]
MKKKILFAILICTFAAGIILGVLHIYQKLNEYDHASSCYTDLRKYIKSPDPAPSEPKGPHYSAEASPSGKRTWPKVDFEALQKINSDIVGWICCEDTDISYPVVQGEDNQYYLKHLFDRTYNSSGCIFLDSRNSADFSDSNSVIYGHHMKNGTMFSFLMKYKNQEYYDKHPEILLLTPNGNYTIELFSGYVTNVESDAWRVSFGSHSEFMQWAENAKEQSVFHSSVTPEDEAHIITLSTCSYEFNNARFVVCGVLKSNQYK